MNIFCRRLGAATRGLPKIVSKGLSSESGRRFFRKCIDGIVPPQKEWPKPLSRFGRS